MLVEGQPWALKMLPKVACVASVSVGFRGKERPRNGILPARNWGESQNKKEGVLPLNPTETLATQATFLFHPGIPLPFLSAKLQIVSFHILILQESGAEGEIINHHRCLIGCRR